VTLNIGVIGVGMIGQDHIRRLTHVLSGARVSAMTDVDLDRAKSVVENLSGAKVHQSGQDLINDDEVDALVNVGAAVNVGYGYDIRGEVLGETSTIELAETSPIVVKSAASHSSRVPADWRERFLRAYDVEFQEWIDAVAAGGSTGPSSWDGYAAAVVTDACVEAFQSGQKTSASLPARPALYAGR
jgi:predicted dehydrogenase